MKTTSKIFAAAAATSLIAAPVAAQERQASSVTQAENMTDAGWFVLIFALAIGFTLLIVADEDSPTSP
ncbi:hypothetical protein [Tsuneonella sp. HG222]